MPETNANENVYHIPGTERVGIQFEDGDTLDFHESILDTPEVAQAKRDIDVALGQTAAAAPRVEREAPLSKETSEPELVARVVSILGDNIKLLRDEELGRAA